MREILAPVLIAEAFVIAAIFAGFIMLAGLACDHHTPTCRAGSVPALFTNCEQIQ